MIFPYKHKTYYGFDDGNAPNVFVSNAGRTIVPLPLRLDIVNHSRLALLGAIPGAPRRNWRWRFSPIG